MTSKLLNSLSMSKYGNLLPRLFPEATLLEIRDSEDAVFWQLRTATAPAPVGGQDSEAPSVGWLPFAEGIERRRLPSGELQFRTTLLSPEQRIVGRLVAGYQSGPSTPMSTAPAPLRRSFDEAAVFLNEELRLNAECNQLAAELTERYEELNLVYATKDQVEHLEEGKEALTVLVHNCADYLDVGFAALICRDRGLELYEANSRNAPPDIEEALKLLSTNVYDRVESQVQSVIINEGNDEERARLIAGRPENLLAYPIVDDYGTAIGVLAVVARKELHTFSNGDRNLLEVMARKAARIIHTHHDPLTGLMNRSGFESTLVTTLAAARSKNLQHCLLHIDIDQLHVVNDLLGYQEGDNLIRRVAKLLRGLVRDSDALARLGGDEFAALLTNCDLNVGRSIAEKIRAAFHEISVISANKQLRVTASIGLVEVGRDTEGIMAVMAAAEIACKSAKEGGNDRIQSYEKDDRALVQRSEEVEWIARLQQSLRDDRFVLHCQAVLPLSAAGQAPHYEMLVRMIDDDGEMLSPGLFMPAAERYQLMPMLDRWVIRNTVEELNDKWDEIGPTGAVFCINLSGQSLTNSGFLAYITDELDRSRVAPRQICFEITETAAISNIDEAIAFIAALQDYGCRFALDDFGAGLSSFGYLKVLPVDYLKIDGSFIREITTDKFSFSMVNAICQIGRTMGLSMIAEFVGDQATVDKLIEIGIDYGQGFFIGKPQPIAEVIDCLISGDQAARV